MTPPLCLHHLFAPSPSGKPSPATNPLRDLEIIAGPVPPSAALHLSIAHLSSPERYEALRGLGRADEEQPEDKRRKAWELGRAEVIHHSKSTLIITGPRQQWHSSLLAHSGSYLTQNGGHPFLVSALDQTSIRYCSSPSQALLLLTLLHAAPPLFAPAASAPHTEPGLPERLESIPSLVVAWDLLGLFLAKAEDEEAGGKGELKFEEGVTIDSYFSLINTLRTALSQLSPPSSPPIQLILLEPHLNASLSLPLLAPAPLSRVKVPQVSPGRQGRRVGVLSGLEGVLGVRGWMVEEEQAAEDEGEGEDDEMGVEEEGLKADKEEKMKRFLVRRNGEAGVVMRWERKGYWREGLEFEWAVCGEDNREWREAGDASLCVL